MWETGPMSESTAPPSPTAATATKAPHDHRDDPFATDPVGEVFADDQLSLKHAALGMIAAAVGGAGRPVGEFARVRFNV